jgi:DNA methylase
VLDPFAGAGSTLVAAKELGRRSLAWEIGEGYHAVASRHVTATWEQLDLGATIETFVATCQPGHDRALCPPGQRSFARLPAVQLDFKAPARRRGSVRRAGRQFTRR